MTIRCGLVLTALLFLVACNPLAPASLPAPQVPEGYSFSPSPPAAQAPDRWWLAFEDPQLDRLEQQLFSGNLDIRQALHRLEQLEAQQRQTAAGRWPSLALNGSANRSQSLGAAGETRSTISSLSLAAGYELDLWNRLADRDEAARLQVLAGADSVKTLLLSLSAQLAEQYFLAMEQQAQLDLLERQKRRSQSLLELVTRRYQTGLVTASALYQAQRNLAAIEAKLPGYRIALTQAEHAIALLLGQAPDSLDLTYRPLSIVSTPVATGIPADLLTRRPDVAMAMHQLAAADHSLAATLAERLPAITLTASLGRAANSLASGDVSGTIWSLGLGLSQPLFDAGRRQAAADQQQAVRAEQLAAVQQILLEAMTEVETSLFSERHFALKADLLDRQLEANAGYLRTSLNNFRFGLSDSTAWLNSEIDQLGILSQQINNKRQWLSQRITLVRALGGSWMAKELENLRMTEVEPQ